MKPKDRARIFVVTTEPFSVKGKTQTTHVDDNTAFEVKSVAVDGDHYVLEPVDSKTEGFRFKVRQQAIKIYTGHLPDYRLDVFFVEFGYQVDHYKNPGQKEGFMQPTHTTCRDFGGDYKIPWLVERMQKFAEKMVLSFKKKL